MNYRVPFVFTFILVVSFQGSNSHGSTPEAYEPDFLSGINQFAGELFKSAAKNNDNFIIAPIGTLSLLGMAAYGAEGHTQQELITAIHSPFFSRGVVLRNYRKLLMDINSAKGVELHLANKLFLEDQYEMEWVFQHVSDVIFQSGAEKIDFENPSNAVATINNWVKEKTHNKIAEIVNAADLERTKLLLVNAAYFKGIWENSFSSELQDKSFHLAQDNSVTIPMMCNYVQYNHGSLSGSTAQYVEIPYESKDSTDKFSMYIIMSNEINGLSGIREKMPQMNVTELNGQKEQLQLCMPKFKLEFELNLIPIMQDMGVHDVFTDSANLSNMGKNNNLKITNIKQKAFLSVDENGTEAASSSVVVVGTKKDNSMTIDRPFIALIASRTTGIPLFWAQISDPRAVSA